MRSLIAIGILASSAYVALTSTPNLGLDLRGGTQIVLEAQSTDRVEANAESTDRALEVIRRRVDSLGVSEPTLARSGDTRIIVELPDVQDPREAERVIGQTAQLTFHSVLGPARPRAKADPDANRPVIPDEDGQLLILAPTAMTGEGVGGADAVQDQTGRWEVDIEFAGNGGSQWAELTGRAACFQDDRRRVAIVLDQEIISSPAVQTSVACDVGIRGGQTRITGDFTQSEAADLAVLIEGGALPLPVEVIERRVMGPTLGDRAVDASYQAGVIGLILTGLFIVLVYRLMGMMATVALATYTLISYAALIALGATLTLPGLAGFVLAIGMAIDANVLVFERAREEFSAHRGRGLRQALTTGYQKAWTAIIDSNVTTLLAAALLFYLATGPVRGFGVTLSIGVVASMISALIVARVLTEWVSRLRGVGSHVAVTGISTLGRVRRWLTERDPDLMRHRMLWIAISATVVVLAVGGMVMRGINLGVEFTGGRLMQYSTAQNVDADDARAVIADAGFPLAVVQETNEGDISVRDAHISNNDVVRIGDALSEIGGETTKERDEFFGPSLGDELRDKALLALGVALAAQMIYLAVRFRWTFGLAAVLAMLHDVLLVVGIFAWLGKTLDSNFLAAALTIIGLSVNDSVVVFDRVRESWRASPNKPFDKVANSSALQTVPRTINTGLGAMFILAALVFLGGDSLTDFALALLLGLFVGTYSSVFTATPLAIVLQSRSKAGPEDRSERRRKVDPYGHLSKGPADDSGAVV
ncbi:MAG: protein translocase subunit SecD [Propionibacteriales bacterium]|nr:protein translocase subunit SecD [Propionibacteriales bacterium]